MVMTSANNASESFDFEMILEELAEKAMHGCGSVYELYQSRFDNLVDLFAAKLDPTSASELTRLATEKYDYSTEGNNAIIVDKDTCIHGLDSWTCPCGCFE